MCYGLSLIGTQVKQESKLHCCVAITRSIFFGGGGVLSVKVQQHYPCIMCEWTDCATTYPQNAHNHYSFKPTLGMLACSRHPQLLFPGDAAELCGVLSSEHRRLRGERR